MACLMAVHQVLHPSHIQMRAPISSLDIANELVYYSLDNTILYDPMIS